MAFRVDQKTRTLEPVSYAWERSLDDSISSAKCSPDGRHLIVGSLSGECLLLDSGNGHTKVTLPSHPMGVLDVAWSHDGALIATAGQDGVVRVSTHEGNELGAARHKGWAARVVWSPVLNQVACAIGRTVVILDAEGQTIVTYPDQTSTVTDLVWSIDGKRLGIAAYGGVRWYDPNLESTEPVKTFAWKGSLLKLTLASTGNWLCHGNQDNSVHVWRVKSGQELEMSGYPAKVDVLEFDPSGRWLAVGTVGVTTVWDCSGKGPEGRRPVSLEGHSRRVSALAWQHRGTRLATGSPDGTVRHWDPAKGRKLIDGFTTQSEVTTLTWSPDDSTLFVGHNDGLVAAHRNPARS